MRMRNGCRLVAMCLVAAPVVRAQSASASLESYLRTSVALDDGQMADLHKGRVVTKVLTTTDRDVAVFGIVAVHVSRAAYEARLRDSSVIAATQLQSFGIIHSPPLPGDLQNITIDDDHYKDLQSCRVNECNFKLPVESMAEFADRVKWNTADEKRQVDSIVTSDAQRFISAYRDSGSLAMVRYDDSGGVKAGDVFAALLGEASAFPDFPQELRDYLSTYPAGRPAAARDLLYWSKDRIPRLRPIISLTHMVVYTPDGATPIVARKQIYADHYFEGAFELLAAFDAPDIAPGPAIYLVDVRRYRFDHLPSGGIFNVRGRVRDHLADVLVADLDRERNAAEGKGK